MIGILEMYKNLIGILFVLGGCGGADLKDSFELRGALRGDGGSGVYVEKSSSVPQGDSSVGDEFYLQAGEEAGYKVVICQDSSSENIRQWQECSSYGQIYIPKSYVERKDQEVLRRLSLAIYQLGALETSEGREDLQRFLGYYEARKIFNNDQKSLAHGGAIVAVIQAILSIWLYRDHQAHRFLQTPSSPPSKYLKFLYHPNVKNMAARIAGSRIITYGALAVVVLSGGLWVHGVRVQRAKLEKLAYVQGPNEGRLIYPTLKALLSSSKEDPTIIEDVDLKAVLISLDQGVERIEENERFRRQAELDLMFYEALEP